MCYAIYVRMTRNTLTSHVKKCIYVFLRHFYWVYRYRCHTCWFNGYSDHIGLARRRDGMLYTILAWMTFKYFIIGGLLGEALQKKASEVTYFHTLFTHSKISRYDVISWFLRQKCVLPHFGSFWSYYVISNTPLRTNVISPSYECSHYAISPFSQSHTHIRVKVTLWIWLHITFYYAVLAYTVWPNTLFTHSINVTYTVTL